MMTCKFNAVQWCLVFREHTSSRLICQPTVVHPLNLWVVSLLNSFRVLHLFNSLKLCDMVSGQTYAWEMQVWWCIADYCNYYVYRDTAFISSCRWMSKRDYNLNIRWHQLPLHMARSGNRHNSFTTVSMPGPSWVSEWEYVSSVYWSLLKWWELESSGFHPVCYLCIRSHQTPVWKCSGMWTFIVHSQAVWMLPLIYFSKW